MSRARAPNRQRGAALLIALLVVALAAMVAGGVVERSQRDVARTASVIDAERAWQYAAGAEGLARAWVRRLREGGPVEPAPGAWTEPFPVPGGTVSARMLDESGKFNLNGLASPDPAEAARAHRGLARLLAAVNVDASLADRVAGLVGRGEARRVRLAHLSELDRLPGFDAELRRRLTPVLAVLPDPTARVNVDRSTPAVLAAVLDGLSLEAARALLARGPFDSMQRLLDQPELAVIDPEIARARLATESRWFMVHARVVLHGRVYDFFRLVGPATSRYDSRYVSRAIP